jgi:hypothetical protein
MLENKGCEKIVYRIEWSWSKHGEMVNEHSILVVKVELWA